jgi:hypothetical protein
MSKLLFSLLLLASPIFSADFISAIDQKNHEAMVSWNNSAQAQEIQKSKNIRIVDQPLADFLDLFVQNEVIKTLLDSRPSYDYTNAVVPVDVDAETQKEEVVENNSNPEKVAYLAWYDSFKKAIEPFGGTLFPSSSHDCPATLGLKFESFPFYVIQFRAKNAYRLGFYDEGGMLAGCVNPGYRISEYEFPIQLLTRILYTDAIHLFRQKNELLNIDVTKKYLYVFPGCEDKSLNDSSLFIVSENYQLDDDAQAAHWIQLKAAYKKYLESGLLDENDQYQNILSELFAVIKSVGIWDISKNTKKMGFVESYSSGITFVFSDIERPAFGGSNPVFFFQQNAEEVASNAAVGLAALIKILTADDVAADEESSVEQDELPSGLVIE